VRNGKQLGPFADDQLKQLASSGKLKPNDLVQRHGMATPVAASQIPGLFQVAQSVPSPHPVVRAAALPTKTNSLAAFGSKLYQICWSSTKRRIVACISVLTLIGVAAGDKSGLKDGTNSSTTNPPLGAPTTAASHKPLQKDALVYEDLECFETLSTTEFIAIPKDAIDLPQEVLSEHYLPHVPGAISEYLFDALGLTTPEGYLRTRFRFTEDGNGLIRRTTMAQMSVMGGRSKLMNSFNPPEETDPPKRRRIRDEFIEIGSQLSPDEPDSVEWDRELKLNCRVGEKWSHKDRFGFTADYALVRVVGLNGTPCAVVTVAKDIDGERSIETRWYLKGIGLIRSESRFASESRIAPEVKAGQLAGRTILEKRTVPGSASSASPAISPFSKPTTSNPTNPPKPSSPVNEPIAAIESYDFSKDDYSKLPAGATRKIRSNRVEKGYSNEIGKWVEEEGYLKSDGTFVLHGRRTLWYDQGHSKKYSEDSYLDGLAHGLNTMWHANGTKAGEVALVHGKNHGWLTSWHDNGTTARKIPYKEGKYHGELTYWYSNGKLREVTHTVEGELHGTSKSWENDGSPNSELSYEHGKLHGPVTRYLTTGANRGQKCGTAIYSNGQVVQPMFSAKSISRSEFRKRMDANSINFVEARRNPNGSLTPHSARWTQRGWVETFGRADRVIVQERAKYQIVALYQCADGPLLVTHNGLLLKGWLVTGDVTEQEVVMLEVTE